MRIESRHGWVEVVEQTPTSRFVVIGRGYGTDRHEYRAQLPVCLFDLCTDGTRTPCVTPLTTHYGRQHAVNGKSSIDAWLKHCETHCHDWHWPTVERFAREVLATYGAAPKFESGRPGIPRGSVQTRFVGAGYVHSDAALVANMTPKAERDAAVKAFGTLVAPNGDAA